MAMLRSPLFWTANLLLAGSLLSAAAAHAQGAPSGAVCVVIDGGRDTLAEGERNAARSLMLQAFEAERVAVDGTGAACAETYTLSNIKLGNTINVTVAGPRGSRTARATTLDDLPNVYSQMVKSLITGEAMVSGGGTTDRTNVTRDQSAPRRVQADQLKYVSLGYGAVIAGRAATGPAFGFGYRYELDKLAIDVSLGFIFANDGDGLGLTGYYPRLAGLWYQQPLADSSPYYGAGLSFGGTAVLADDDKTYSGSGLQGHLTAGYEAFRSSTIRFFGQLDVTMPFYVSDIDFESSDKTKYTPSLSLSIGLGWGKGNTVRVIND